jgi:ferredoxin
MRYHQKDVDDVRVKRSDAEGKPNLSHSQTDPAKRQRQEHHLIGTTSTPSTQNPIATQEERRMNVEIKKSDIEGAGRGLFATKSFKPGDVVHTIARPSVAELDTERLQDTCAWCFHKGPSEAERQQAAALGLPEVHVDTKACTGCRKVRYCTRACQAKAWKREHKYECKVISVPGRPDLPHGVRAAIKLLGRLQADPEGKDESLLDILQFKPASDGKALEWIHAHQEQKWEDFNMLAYGAWKYCGEPKHEKIDFQSVCRAFFFNVSLLQNQQYPPNSSKNLTTILQINCNTISLASPLDDVSLGLGFDNIVCSANHSCDPNLFVVFNQPQLLIRALKPIRKGDELFIKYVDTTNPFSVRQAELSSQYLFSCHCPKCKQGATHAEDKLLLPADQLKPQFVTTADNLVLRYAKQLHQFFIPAIPAEAQRRVSAIQAEAFAVSGTTFDYQKGNSSSSEEEVKDALKLCLNSGMWSFTRQPVPHLLRQLQVHYMSTGEVYRAWRIGAKKHFECAPTLFPQKFYPDRVIDTWCMANVTKSLCDNPATREIYVETKKGGLDLQVVFLGFMLELHDGIEKSYGWESPFGRVVAQAFQQVMASVPHSVEKVREDVKATWPKLEAVAKSVDVLLL